MGRFLAVSLLLLLCMGLLPLFGCSSGTLALDGGGFPIGGRVYGIVTSSEDPRSVVANATVFVASTNHEGKTISFQTTTDTNGLFDFSFQQKHWLDDPIGQVKVSVQPAPGSDRLAQTLAFTVTHGQAANLFVALPRAATFDPASVASIAMTVSSPALHSNDFTPIFASLKDATGKVLPERPSLLFLGGFGALGVSGNDLFSGTIIGAQQSGVLVALFDQGGVRQLQTIPAVVTADSKSTQLPPPDPDHLPPPPTWYPLAPGDPYVRQAHWPQLK